MVVDVFIVYQATSSVLRAIIWNDGLSSGALLGRARNEENQPDYCGQASSGHWSGWSRDTINRYCQCQEESQFSKSGHLLWCGKKKDFNNSFFPFNPHFVSDLVGKLGLGVQIRGRKMFFQSQNVTAFKLTRYVHFVVRLRAGKRGENGFTVCFSIVNKRRVKTEIGVSWEAFTEKLSFKHRFWRTL